MILGLMAILASYNAQKERAGFQYRFNRRFALEALIPRMAFANLRTPHITHCLLKLSLG
jgi:hypothetical protein